MPLTYIFHLDCELEAESQGGHHPDHARWYNNFQCLGLVRGISGQAGGCRSGVSGETRACYHPLQAGMADPGQISQEAQRELVKMG